MRSTRGKQLQVTLRLMGVLRLPFAIGATGERHVTTAAVAARQARNSALKAGRLRSAPLVLAAAVCVLPAAFSSARAQLVVTAPDGQPAKLFHPRTLLPQEVSPTEDATHVSVVPLSSTGNLVYQGGPVMVTDAVYTIYWAPAGHPIPTTYKTLLNRYFTDIGGSAFY